MPEIRSATPDPAEDEPLDEERPAFAAILNQLDAHRQRLTQELAEIDALSASLQALQSQVAHRLHRAEAPERMSIARAARYIGVGRSSMYRIIDAGLLPTSHYQEASARVAILKSDLDAFIAEHPTPRRRRRTSRPA